ncbi:malate synthase A [Persicobacter diffluens]|uniref:Malate synthase n=1 Tax=Persicobacter diffluens TaxID=981 RepID=A0AAN4W0N2_9BACT|nr:malate synthase [Persicobacter diffluens]
MTIIKQSEKVALLQMHPANATILSPEAIAFIQTLHDEFNGRRIKLLEDRKEFQQRLNKGERPGFLPDTKHIRLKTWKVGPLPVDILDRRVEITGPVDRKMIINALNSGANVFMADFEDSTSPTWSNVIEGQLNLRDAVKREIAFTNPTNGKHYELKEEIATLFVRPRGLHLEEKHFLIDGERISASLFDFGLYLFHNHLSLREKSTGPYFYLPKLEHYQEARWWNEVFVFAQDYLNIPQGTIKATVLIETITASFMMDEILYELKDHSAGLNCGRWDYIFSYIKKFHAIPEFLVPDRAQVGMDKPFMKAYSQLLIKTCHKRGVHAMGGMAAQIPIKNDEEANTRAMEKVRNDKLREVKAGHDGTWVAHPGLISMVKEVFNLYMPRMNNLHVERGEVKVSAEMLVEVPQGSITFEGLVNNIDVCLQYLEAWLNGNGCVPIYHLMEDAATAEISRTQVWQWLHHAQARLEDGREVNENLYQEARAAAIDRIKALVGDAQFEAGRYQKAIELFDEMTLSNELEEFLTLKAYEFI